MHTVLKFQFDCTCFKRGELSANFRGKVNEM